MHSDRKLYIEKRGVSRNFKLLTYKFFVTSWGFLKQGGRNASRSLLQRLLRDSHAASSNLSSFPNMNRKPGDWDCPSCDHLNFSWRDSCQRCSEPKPREGHGGKVDERRGYGRGGGSALHGFESGYAGGRGSATELIYGRNNGAGGDYRSGYGGDYRVGYGGDPRSGYGADPRGGYGGDLRSSYGSDPRSGYGGDYRGGYEMDYRSGYGVDYRSGYTGDYRNGYGGDYRGNYGGGDYMNRSYAGEEYSGRSFGAGDYNSRSYGGIVGSGGSDTRPGDWYCKESSCGAHNFASRTSCFKCGVAKDERGGKGKGDSGRGGGYESGGRGARGSAQDSANAGDGDRPGWRSGDWMCTRSGCNEHNFATRLQCFRCQAPRDT